MKRKTRITIVAGIAVAGLALAYSGSGGSALAHPGGGSGPGGSGQPGYSMSQRGFGMGQHRGFHRGGFRRHRRRAQKPLVFLSLRFRDELKLNEGQIAKLEKLRSGFARRMIGERAAMRTLRFDIRQALKADKVDLLAAEKLVRAASKKRGDIALAHIRTIERGKALLTKEQLKELKTLVSRHGRGFMGHSGPMMGMHREMMGKGHEGPSGMSESGKLESGKGKKF